VKPDNKLSEKEAALIAQARAELKKRSGAQATASVARVKRTLAPAASEAAAPGAMERAAPAGARPAASPDAAERVATLMAATRAENERQRRRQRQIYLWTPLAFMCVVGMWALIWMWRRL
jgi:hypothetical protein